MTKDSTKTYKQKFRREWLSMPAFSKWLTEVPGDPSKAHCRFCSCDIRAKFSLLDGHCQTKKHTKAVVPPNAIPLINYCSRKSMDLKKAKIGFIGAGNMAQALIKGFIDKDLVMAENIIVSAPSKRNFKKLNELEVKATHDNNEVVEQCSVVFLATKPYDLKQVICTHKDVFSSTNALFISIAAGVPIIKIESWISGSSARVARVMPNTPCLVGEGVCAYSMGTCCTSEDKEILGTLLSSVGICELVKESMMDGICGLAGSGPAYIYAAIEAMADGAVKMGVPRNIATKFAAQTVRGASTMVLETGKHPGELKDEVCSPGGTTITAMHELEKHGFRNSLICAVEAAATKSLIMSSTSM